jgi:FkbM family methyltransferase
VAEQFYRSAPKGTRRSVGWITHVWKSVTRQDHAKWRSTLRRMVPKDGVAIDVGAHGGQFTRLLTEIVPRGLVLAIEPSSYARSVLRTALWIRGVSNVIVVAAAIGAESGIAVLHTPIKRRGDMGYGLAHLGSCPQEGPGERVAEPVAVTTLDALIAALQLSRVDFVKADIEGYEAALIAGARATLKRCRPPLLLEHDADHLARTGSSLDALWAELTSLGYRPHKLIQDELTSMEANEPMQGDVLWLPGIKP